jgi:aminopeptidase N
VTANGKDYPVTESLSFFEKNDPGAYGAIVYAKGALFFAALRDEIGDQAFFNALRNYYAENSFRIATNQDLLDAFEQASGRSLDSFYQEWLY